MPIRRLRLHSKVISLLGSVTLESAEVEADADIAAYRLFIENMAKGFSLQDCFASPAEPSAPSEDSKADACLADDGYPLCDDTA